MTTGTKSSAVHDPWRSFVTLGLCLLVALVTVVLFAATRG